MADRSHLSIGEVLGLLQDDFPDVTISKIRFLESQGLLDPERTPSGYRKFYETDIERLRWILRHQRDHFLPLKVMKDRLGGGDRRRARGAPRRAARRPAGRVALAVRDRHRGRGRHRARGGAARRAPRAAPPGLRPPSATAAKAPPNPPRRAAPPMPDLPPRPAVNPLDAGPTGLSLSLPELADAAGVTTADLEELQRYGLLTPHTVAGETFYDGEALIVARTAAGFLRFGVEARHLRMYKVAAEREAGLMEQLLMPLLKQRNPSARQQAADNLGELAGLGEQLRSALLRSALRDHTELR